MNILDPGSGALCLPQAMWIVYQVAMERTDLRKEEILDLVTPVAMRARLPQNGAHVQSALDGLCELRLLQVDAEGLYSAKRVRDSHEFLRVLRRRLVSPPEEVGDGFTGAPDLRAALIWLMRRDPSTPLHWRENVETTMPTGLFTNDTRWNGFRWWSEALGFAREGLKSLMSHGGQRTWIVPDPSEAVIDAIEHPLGPALPRDTQLPIKDLLAFLRSELPVLPGHPSATYAGPNDEEGQASPALGLALAAAEQRHILSMRYQSDPSGVLALPDAQNFGQDRYVSTVTIGKRP